MDSETITTNANIPVVQKSLSNSNRI
jgi:hypothetical protein